MKKLLKFFLKGIAAVIAFSPRQVQIFLGWCIGFLWFDVLRIRRKVVLGNLEKAFPEWTAKERLRVARKSMHHLGLTIVEFCLFPFFKKSWLADYFGIENEQSIFQAQSGGKGLLILGMHLGNGDLGMVGLAYTGLPMHLISKNFSSKWLNDIWFSLRGRHGTQFISDRKSSFDILKTVKRGGRVVFVLDQFTGRPLGIKTRFFSIETGTASGLALFAQRTRVPVYLSFAYRDKNYKTVVVFEGPLPYIESEGMTQDEVMLANTQLYNDAIERVVRKYPEQWMWVHKRWKHFVES